MIVRNLITQEIKTLSIGQRGIIRGEEIFLAPAPAATEAASETSEAVTEEESEDMAPPVSTGPKTSDIPTDTSRQLRNTSTILLQSRNSVQRTTSTSAPSSVGTVGTRETDGSGTAEEGATASSSGTESSSGSGSNAETSSNPSPGARPTRAERQPRTLFIHVD